MKEITCWYRYNEDTKQWIYNHYIVGHITINNPALGAKFNKQYKAWINAKWRKEFKYLKEGKIVECCGGTNNG